MISNVVIKLLDNKTIKSIEYKFQFISKNILKCLRIYITQKYSELYCYYIFYYLTQFNKKL